MAAPFGPPMAYDPATLGSLSNTLTPEGLQTIMEAAQKAQQEELARKTAAAAAASQQAGQAYQGAAAAPPPQVDPLSQFIPTLFGHIASVIGQDKSFTTRAAENVGDQRKALMDARLQNLSALRANSDRKAAALEQAGHDEEAGKARMQTEKFDKLYQTLMEQERVRAATTAAATKVQTDKDAAAQDQKDALERIRVTGTESRKTQSEKPATGALDPDFDPKSYVETTSSGREFINQSRVPQVKYKQAVTNFGRSQKIPIVTDKGRSALDLVAAGRENLASMQETLAGKLSTSKNPLKIIWKGLSNKASAALQTDPKLTSYGAFRTAAVEAMQTIASLGVGFRINRDEIRLAMQNDIPNLGDTVDTAENRIAILSKMFDHVEDAVLSSGADVATFGGVGRAIPDSSEFNDYRKAR